MIKVNPVSRANLEASISDQRTVLEVEALFDAVIELQSLTADLQALLDGQAYVTEVANQTKQNFSTVQTLTTGPVIDADTLAVGDVFDVDWVCFYSSTGTPTYTFAIKMGATTVRSFAFATTLNAANAVFMYRQTFVVKSIGATGTVECTGERSLGTTADAATLGTVLASTPTLTVVNTTVPCTITSTVNCSAPSPSNTVTQRCLRIVKRSS